MTTNEVPRKSPHPAEKFAATALLWAATRFAPFYCLTQVPGSIWLLVNSDEHRVSSTEFIAVVMPGFVGTVILWGVIFGVSPRIVGYIRWATTTPLAAKPDDAGVGDEV